MYGGDGSAKGGGVMGEHSPGPWRANWGQILDLNGLVVADLGQRVTEMEHGKDRVLAVDARLIAAAPELLQIARDLQVADETWIHEVERRAKALVRRIEGEE